jgi:mersacidin/lichenicidin family type 2 lantibiotic
MNTMNTDDVIAAWKEPAIRAGLAEQELMQIPQHPAGRSPFEREPMTDAGASLPITLRTIGALTSFMSCNIACSETMWDGSCDFFTYGCCM